MYQPTQTFKKPTEKETTCTTKESRKRMRNAVMDTSNREETRVDRYSTRSTNAPPGKRSLFPPGVPPPTPGGNLYFASLPERVLFGIIMGLMDSHGTQTTWRLRDTCRTNRAMVNEYLFASCIGDRSDETADDENTAPGENVGGRRKRRKSKDHIGEIVENKTDTAKNTDGLRMYLECSPEPREHSAGFSSPIKVLRSDAFMANHTLPHKDFVLSPKSKINYPLFEPSTYTTMGRRMARLLNAEFDETVTDPAVPRKLFKLYLNSLNKVQHLTVLESFYICTCKNCDELYNGMFEEGGPGYEKKLKLARRHACDRLFLVFQIIIRNRNSLITAHVEGPPRRVAYNEADDDELPNVRDFVPGLSDLDRTCFCSDPVNRAASKITRLFEEERGVKWNFPNLLSVHFSATVDVRHAIPLIDGSNLPELHSVEFAWLKAEYHLFPPQYGRLPIAVFAPINLFTEKKDEDAPHLPAIYNGSLDSSYKLDGLGMYSCPIYTYEGNFEAGLNSKYGKMKANTGETYEGLWHRGLRYGHGRVTQDAGCIMEGTWHEDLLHGIGYIVKPCGLFYLGQWYHSAWDGWGIFAYKGRLIAYGQYSHGLLHGWARILAPDEGWEDSWWNRGKRICDEEQTPGQDATRSRRAMTAYYEGKTILYATTQPPGAMREGGETTEYYIYKKKSANKLSSPFSPLKCSLPIESPVVSSNLVKNPSILGLDTLPTLNGSPRRPVPHASTSSEEEHMSPPSSSSTPACQIELMPPGVTLSMSPSDSPNQEPPRAVASVVSPGSISAGNRSGETLSIPLAMTAFSSVSTGSPTHAIYRPGGGFSLDEAGTPSLARQNAMRSPMGSPGGVPFSLSPMSSPQYVTRLEARLNGSIGDSTTSPSTAGQRPQRLWAEESSWTFSSSISSPITPDQVGNGDRTRDDQQRMEAHRRDHPNLNLRERRRDFPRTRQESNAEGSPWSQRNAPSPTDTETSGSEWFPSENSSPISSLLSDDASTGNVSVKKMAFKRLTEIAESCSWDNHSVENVEGKVGSEAFKAFQREMKSADRPSMARLLRTTDGAAHVRYPPAAEDPPYRATPTGTTMKLAGAADSMTCLNIARPRKDGDSEIPHWLASHLQEHYGIEDPLEPLKSDYIFNVSHAPFFDANILEKFREESLKKHLERREKRKEACDKCREIEIINID